MSTLSFVDGRITYILSAEREEFTIGQNAHAMKRLATLLAAELAAGHIFTMAHAEGAYKGTPERSIVVVAPCGWIGQASQLGRMFGQESILRMGSAGTATLHFMREDDAELIGSYTELESTDGVDAWTRILATGETFTFT